MGTDPITEPLVSVMQSTPAPLSCMDGVQLEEPARGTHKRNLSVYREEGYRVTMETDSPTPVADGGGECIGGWVSDGGIQRWLSVPG